MNDKSLINDVPYVSQCIISVKRKRHKFAVASFVLGIVSIIPFVAVFTPCPVIGIVLGSVALHQTRKPPYLSGRGFAITGVACASVAMILVIPIYTVVGVSVLLSPFSQKSQSQKTALEEAPKEEASETQEEKEVEIAEEVVYPTREEWREVKHWEGSGITTTETFKINSKQWRISWDFKEGMIFQVYVYKENGWISGIATNQSGSGKGTSYMHSGPGEYHLKINSALGSWIVIVEEKALQ